ncbi:MAG TPA: F0F1 ATP synthase subunit B [Candidatus Eubacterium faecigallinarum]|nr:F0F1 ATP synthase subunit B [Candidatus Eubacterium faecigallinarum]
MLKFDWNMLWTLINLIVFFLLMKFFLFNPIKKVLNKRKELIDKQFKDAEEAQRQAEDIKTQYQNQLDGVEEEKKQILATARTTAKNEYNKIIDKAHDDADKIKSDAKKASDFENEKTRRAVKEEIAALAMETAEKVVGKSASAQLDSKLYDEFLEESSD